MDMDIVVQAAPYVVGAGVALVAAPVALTAVGFGSAGIAAGSYAAGAMSYFGIVTAGSTFATLQSVGMAGMGIAGKAVLAGVGAAVGKGVTDYFNSTVEA